MFSLKRVTGLELNHQGSDDEVPVSVPGALVCAVHLFQLSPEASCSELCQCYSLMPLQKSFEIPGFTCRIFFLRVAHFEGKAADVLL